MNQICSQADLRVLSLLKKETRIKVCTKGTLELNLKNLNTFVKLKSLEKGQKTNIKLFRWTNFQKNHKISHN